MIKSVLAIGGSDPSGGAGIQADLKTFSALGVYGMAAITALTAQNTLGVYDTHTPSADFLRSQLTNVFKDINPDAIKIGMLSNSDNVDVLIDCISNYDVKYTVLDPVLSSSSGTPLLDPRGLTLLRENLLPKVSLVTPNIPEVALLLGINEPSSENEMLEAAQQLRELTKGHVLLKGGHLLGEESNDLLVTKEGQIHWFREKRVKTQNSHGTGCTLSSAIAAYLAITEGDVLQSVKQAKTFVLNALKGADKLDLGQGNGPLNHFV